MTEAKTPARTLVAQGIGTRYEETSYGTTVGIRIATGKVVSEHCATCGEALTIGNTQPVRCPEAY